jgi:hypothetical protein
VSEELGDIDVPLVVGVIGANKVDSISLEIIARLECHGSKYFNDTMVGYRDSSVKLQTLTAPNILSM